MLYPGLQLDIIENVTVDPQLVLKEFEIFCRHKALEKAIIESTDLLEKQDYGTVENKIKDAIPSRPCKRFRIRIF